MRGFREVREVKPNFEVRKTDKEKEEGYKQIKPKTDITVTEAKKFWDGLFVESMGES